MPRGSEELVKARKSEILNAARELYRKCSFNEISIKDIGEITSFTRTSIYNYFSTKEEIFLSLLKEEYEEWIRSLEKIGECDSLDRKEFALAFSRTLDDSEEMLKLLSMNYYDIEKNSSFDFLVDFKKSFIKALDTVRMLLRKFFPSYSDSDVEGFIYSFFPFMYGIYPYTKVTDRQIEAMKKAGYEYRCRKISDFVYDTVIKLLGGE